MVYQEAIPPIPSRNQQQVMIRKLEQDWLKQPWYKFYMNEDIRKNKMNYVDKIYKTRKQFAANIVLFGVLLLPLLFFTRRFSMFQYSRLPLWNKPNTFRKYRTQLQIRNKNHYKYGLPLYFILTISMGSYFTDWKDKRNDENFVWANKVERML